MPQDWENCKVVGPASRGEPEAQNRLEAVGIIVNRNTIPHDTRSPFDPSGIRIGTPSLTTRGMKEKEMGMVAAWIESALKDPSEKNCARVNREVKTLCKKFLLPED